MVKNEYSYIWAKNMRPVIGRKVLRTWNNVPPPLEGY